MWQIYCIDHDRNKLYPTASTVTASVESGLKRPRIKARYDALTHARVDGAAGLFGRGEDACPGQQGYETYICPSQPCLLNSCDACKQCLLFVSLQHFIRTRSCSDQVSRRPCWYHRCTRCCAALGARSLHEAHQAAYAWPDADCCRAQSWFVMCSWILH